MAKQDEPHDGGWWLAGQGRPGERRLTRIPKWPATHRPDDARGPGEGVDRKVPLGGNIWVCLKNYRSQCDESTASKGECGEMRSEEVGTAVGSLCSNSQGFNSRQREATQSSQQVTRWHLYLQCRFNCGMSDEWVWQERRGLMDTVTSPGRGDKPSK